MSLEGCIHIQEEENMCLVCVYRPVKIDCTLLKFSYDFHSARSVSVCFGQMSPEYVFEFILIVIHKFPNYKYTNISKVNRLHYF